MILTTKYGEYKCRRIFCVGRNYREHIRELNNETPGSPVIFMKPATALLAKGEVIRLPENGEELHFEGELVILVGREGRPGSAAEAVSFIHGYTLGLDLTKREVQQKLKSKGLPWELSKAFDGSAPIGEIVATADIAAPGKIGFSTLVNGQERQHGVIGEMIWSPEELLYYLGRHWKLLPGDLVYTGTPQGVGKLAAGDKVILNSEQLGTATWSVE